MLGGSGDFSRVHEDYPFPQEPPNFKYYFLGIMGYHLHSLVDLLCRERRSEFSEMFLHHVITVLLYGMAYMLNLGMMGAIVSFLHDISDIFAMSVRGFSELKFRTPTVTSAVLMGVSWFWTRLMVFPYFIYVIVFKQEHMAGSYFFKYFTCFLLSILLFLHFHWFTGLCFHLRAYTKRQFYNYNYD